MQEKYLVQFHLSNGVEQTETIEKIRKENIENFLKLKYFDRDLEIFSIENIEYVS